MPDAVAPPPRHPRFPLFDGLRALAVGGVVLVHAVSASTRAEGASIFDRLLAHMNIGVTIFFVISGFLLYRPFVAHRGGGAPAPRLSDYAKRRFLRIYPAYWLVLTILTLAPGTTGVHEGHWWQQYAILDTLPLHSGTSCAGDPAVCGLAQTWSLVIELTFYGLLPLYAVAAAWLFRGLKVRTWLWAELALLGCLSVPSAVRILSDTHPLTSAWFVASAMATFLWFALGMGLAVASVALGSREAKAPPRATRLAAAIPTAPWVAAVGLYVALCLWLPPGTFAVSRTDVLVTYLAFGLIAALLVLPAVFGDRRKGLPRAVLAHPAMAWIGLVSYGIFLWHYAVLLQISKTQDSFWVLMLGTIAVTVPIAAASYYLIERPILRLKYERVADILRRGRARRQAESGNERHVPSPPTT